MTWYQSAKKAESQFGIIARSQHMAINRNPNKPLASDILQSAVLKIADPLLSDLESKFVSKQKKHASYIKLLALISFLSPRCGRGREDLVATAVPAATVDSLIGACGSMALHDIDALFAC
jgi:hypothetical protein